MSRIIIESAQGLVVSLTITALIAVFVIGVLRLMFNIMDKIGKGQKAFGAKDRPVTEPVKAERFKEGGVVHLNIPEVKPPMPTAPAQPPQQRHCTVNKTEKEQKMNKEQFKTQAAKEVMAALLSNPSVIDSSNFTNPEMLAELEKTARKVAEKIAVHYKEEPESTSVTVSFGGYSSWGDMGG